MSALLSLTRFGRQVQSGRGKRRPPCKPRLEVLEARNLLAFVTTVAPMPTARFGVAVTRGSDGLIYAMGGQDASFTPVETVEAYNPQTDTWSTRADFEDESYYPAAAPGPDGHIYLFGGADDMGNVLSEARSYTPILNRWSFVADMPTARFGLAAVRGSNGLIYAIGGFDATFSSSSVVEAYSTQTGTWLTRAPLNTPRFAPAAALGPNGKIYVFGGDPGTGFATSSVECYTPNTNTWTFVAPMPVGVETAAAVLGPNGRIFVIDGSTSISNADATNVVQAYNPLSDTWSIVPTTPAPQVRAALGAALGFNGKIYAIGGIDPASNVLDTTEAFSALSGFAPPPAAGSPGKATGNPDSITPSAATVNAYPLLGAMNQWLVSAGGVNDFAGQQPETNAKFASDPNLLAADLTDALFAGGIG